MSCVNYDLFNLDESKDMNLKNLTNEQLLAIANIIDPKASWNITFLPNGYYILNGSTTNVTDLVIQVNYIDTDIKCYVNMTFEVPIPFKVMTELVIYLMQQPNLYEEE